MKKRNKSSVEKLQAFGAFRENSRGVYYRVMVTQTWAYFHAQLDYPPYKKIKVHVLQDNSPLSFCGLKNVDDEGEYTKDQLMGEFYDHTCKKCRRSAFVKLPNGSSRS